MTTLFYTVPGGAKNGQFFSVLAVDGKNRAFSELRIDGHLAAVEERQVLHNESQSGTAHVARPGAVDPVKTLEQPFQMLRQNPVAIVLDKVRSRSDSCLTVTVPPSRLNLMPLSIRFVSICSRRRESAETSVSGLTRLTRETPCDAGLRRERSANVIYQLMQIDRRGA